MESASGRRGGEGSSREDELVIESDDDTIEIEVEESGESKHRSDIFTDTSHTSKGIIEQEHKDNNMQKKNSQPLMVQPQKQPKPKQQVKSQVFTEKNPPLPPVQTFLNPFQPKILSLPGECPTKCLLILISVQPIKSIQITSLHFIERRVKHTSTILRFADTHFVLAHFEVTKKEQYDCCVSYADDSLTRHKVVKSEPFEGVSLTIIVRASLGIEQKRKSLNFAIFQAISFLLDHVVSKTHTVQKQLFPWFNQLYEHFCTVNEQSTEEILTRIEICKNDPRKSQYFLYFFKAVYKSQSLQLYQKYKLQSKMSFAFVCRIVNKNYPHSQELCNFYLQVNLIFAINNHIIYTPEELNNLVYFNIGCQSPATIYSLFLRLAAFVPKQLVGLDEDVKRVFIDERSLTVEEYIVLKGRYFRLMIEKRPASHQVACLMQFIKDLVDMSYTRPADQFQPQESLFQKSLLAQFQRILKLPQLDLPKFYSKCKLLKSLSRETINLLDLSLQILREKQAALIRHSPVKMVLSLLIQPTSPYDIEQLNRIFSQRLVATGEWIEVIRELVETSRNSYNIEYIEEKFVEIYEEIDVGAIAQKLDKMMVANRQKKTKGSEARLSLIGRLFMIFTSQTKVANCLTLKKLLDSCSSLRDPFLKQAFLNKIFKEIQRNSSSEEYLQFVAGYVGRFDAHWREKCVKYLSVCRESRRQ